MIEAKQETKRAVERDSRREAGLPEQSAGAFRTSDGAARAAGKVGFSGNGGLA